MTVDELIEELERAVIVARSFGGVVVGQAHLRQLLEMARELRRRRQEDDIVRQTLRECEASAVLEANTGIPRCFCGRPGRQAPDGSTLCDHCWSGHLRSIPG